MFVIIAFAGLIGIAGAILGVIGFAVASRHDPLMPAPDRRRNLIARRVVGATVVMLDAQ